MAESKNDLTENKKKRPNKLTNARIKKEIEFLEKMFVGVDDENKKTLINSLIEEAAFLKVACFQAKEELKKEGLTTETVNASQKFVKAHPSTQIYEKYSRQYTAIIHSLIEYLPPKEKEKVEQVPFLKALIVPLDKLAEMRVKIEQDGTRENILYKKAADLMK